MKTTSKEAVAYIATLERQIATILMEIRELQAVLKEGLDEDDPDVLD